MGFIEAEERRQVEVEEFKRMVLQAVAICGGGKDEDEFTGLRSSPAGLMDGGDGGEKVVCVTSGVSFLGLAIVNRLLSRGYSVRIMVDNEEDIEKLRELETSNCNKVKAVMAKVSDVESLAVAFQGCRGVFHTSAFTDPAGLSGYTVLLGEALFQVEKLVKGVWLKVLLDKHFSKTFKNISFVEASNTCFLKTFGFKKHGKQLKV